MAVKLNLLPQNYIVSGPLSAILKISKPLTVILLAVFLATALGITLFFIFSQVTLNKLNASNKTLNGQIESQKAAQNQLVLLKDRLGKIKTVMAKNASSRNLASVEPIIKTLTPSSSIDELNLDSQKTDLIVGFVTNSTLSDYFKTISLQNTFSGILLNSLNYDLEKGYVVDVAYSGQETVKQ